MSQPMAAAKRINAQLKAMLRRIKFSTDASMELVTGKGINSIECIKTLTQDCVTRLCSIIREPGRGTNGHVLCKAAENTFRLLVYYFQHQDRVIWDTKHSLVTLLNLCAICGQRELVKDWDLTITKYVKPILKDI